MPPTLHALPARARARRLVAAAGACTVASLGLGLQAVPAGEERSKMFQGHMANMQRLANEGKLVLGGPFDGTDGWRGLFIFAVPDIEAARQLTATDPVIVNGEMVAEYHKYFGSASLMLVNEWHKKITKPEP